MGKSPFFRDRISLTHMIVIVIVSSYVEEINTMRPSVDRNFHEAWYRALSLSKKILNTLRRG